MDDWSLKDKRVLEIKFKTENPDFYYKDDINILRLKLIEDFTYFFMSVYNKDGVIKKVFPKLYKQTLDRCINDIESVINKRFGVDK